jgi:hypothetical protein
MTDQRGSPTLVETILWLKEHEPSAFGGIDESAVRGAARDYYEGEVGRLGGLMVSRGTITKDQLGLALAKQAILHGRTTDAAEHLRRTISDARDRFVELATEVISLFDGLVKRSSR